jgi:putative phosphoesterase
MKIGLIADTHLPSAGKELSPRVAEVFEGVDLILHAGDIYLASCLDWLEGIAPVKAVMGALDHLQGDPRVEARTRVVELEGHAIGMTHELVIPGMTASEVLPGAIRKRFPANASMTDAMKQVFGALVDIVVLGFSHETLVEEHAGILFISPGSATWPHQRIRLGTVGILDLTPESREIRIVDMSQLD